MRVRAELGLRELQSIFWIGSYGCGFLFRVLVVGALATRAPLFGVYIRGAGLWKLAYIMDGKVILRTHMGFYRDYLMSAT